MCLVEVEKTPKLQTACTLPVAEGMVVHTESPQVVEGAQGACSSSCSPTIRSIARSATRAASANCRTWCSATAPAKAASPRSSITRRRKAVVAGGLLRRAALHPLLPLRARLRRRHGRGRAGRRQPRRRSPRSFPTSGDHLECDECGMCIDICPVGALTSGTYRYQTRPWEMEHVGTICTHCGDGCKTTLGVRNDEIIRGNNRDRSGINGEFLCVKGRYGFDFIEHPERLQSPLLARERQAWSRSPGRRLSTLVAAEVRGSARRAAASSASSAPTTPPTKRTTSCRSSRGRDWGPTTSTTTAPATSSTLARRALAARPARSATAADLYNAQSRAGDRRRPGAAASASSPIRFAPTSGITQAARLRGHAGPGSRGPVSPRQSVRAHAGGEVGRPSSRLRDRPEGRTRNWSSSSATRSRATRSASWSPSAIRSAFR